MLLKTDKHRIKACQKVSNISVRRLVNYSDKGKIRPAFIKCWEFLRTLTKLVTPELYMIKYFKYWQCHKKEEVTKKNFFLSEKVEANICKLYNRLQLFLGWKFLHITQNWLHANFQEIYLNALEWYQSTENNLFSRVFHICDLNGPLFYIV